MFYRCPFLLLIFSLLIAWTDACSCVPPGQTRKQRFCAADFTFRGTAYFNGLQFLNNEWYRRFCFNIEYIKKPQNTPLPSTCVLTPYWGSRCGIQYQDGILYIVNGNIVNNLMFVNWCGWNERWNNVPRSARVGLTLRFWCSIVDDRIQIPGGILTPG